VRAASTYFLTGQPWLLRDRRPREAKHLLVCRLTRAPQRVNFAEC
jgi:hypothetical protein